MKILKWIAIVVVSLIAFLVLVGLWGDMDKIDRLGVSIAAGAAYLTWAIGQQIDRVMKGLQAMHRRLDDLEQTIRLSDQCRWRGE